MEITGEILTIYIYEYFSRRCERSTLPLILYSNSIIIHDALMVL